MTNHLEETRYYGPSNNTLIGVSYLNSYKRRALDLGCGSLRHSKYLSNCGFIVDAIDKDSEVAKYSDFFAHRPKNLFNLIIADYNKVDLGEEKYDIVVAQNTLSFNTESVFESLIVRVLKSLKRNCVFSGNLYGINDFRSKSSNMTFFSLDSARCLLTTLGDIEYFYEFIGEDQNSGHCLHTFEFVIIKP